MVSRPMPAGEKHRNAGLSAQFPRIWLGSIQENSPLLQVRSHERTQGKQFISQNPNRIGGEQLRPRRGPNDRIKHDGGFDIAKRLSHRFGDRAISEHPNLNCRDLHVIENRTKLR
jgi:hypothetical protein